MKEPLKASGELWMTGWDIPTKWAIDADGKCYINDAHGGRLEEVTVAQLLATPEEGSDRARLRGILGLKPELPSWVRAARAAGWNPPVDWDESQYDP